MPAVLLLIFIALPLLEIALLIKFGQNFGFWPAFGLVIATAVAGSVLLRQQGLAVWRRINDDVRSGRPPIDSVADGFLLLVAGAFLVSPGLITDTIGLLLLIPAVRVAVRRLIASRVTMSGTIFSTGSNGTVPKAVPKTGPRSGSAGLGAVIDGEFERLGEKTTDPRRSDRS